VHQGQRPSRAGRAGGQGVQRMIQARPEKSSA
jgi:hypothetical protein